MLTVCEAQDSIKFSIAETKILLSHHVNYKNLQKIVDSCDIQEAEFRNTIKNDSIMLFNCKGLVSTKQKTIELSNKQTEELKKNSSHNKYWKIFWRRCSVLFIGISTVECGIIYLIVQ